MRIRLGDLEVGYTERGAGPPAVMVHGLAEDRRSWAVVQERLADHRTLAYDLRGHGETRIGHGEGTLDQLAGDLARFLEALTGPAACLGYSLGGTVVLAAAAARPDLVTRAVVSGTSSVVGRAAAGFFEERIALLGSNWGLDRGSDRDSDRPAFEAALRDDTAAQIVTPGADLDAIVARRIEAVGDGRGYVNAARAMQGLHDTPLTGALARIRCPVDVIGGDGDRFCPRRAADLILAELVDGAYHEIRDCGHLMTVDQPEAYSVALRAALERPDAREGARARARAGTEEGMKRW